MQSDIIAKLDVIKSDLRTRWSKSSDFGPKSDDSVHRFSNRKMASVFHQVVTEQSLVRAVRGSHRCTSNDRWVEIRIQQRCVNAVAASLRTRTLYIYIASCRWTRARTYCREEEQRTQRASFAGTYHTRVHHSGSSSSRSSSWWARMLG